ALLQVLLFIIPGAASLLAGRLGRLGVGRLPALSRRLFLVRALALLRILVFRQSERFGALGTLQSRPGRQGFVQAQPGLARWTDRHGGHDRSPEVRGQVGWSAQEFASIALTCVSGCKVSKNRNAGPASGWLAGASRIPTPALSTPNHCYPLHRRIWYQPERIKEMKGFERPIRCTFGIR